VTKSWIRGTVFAIGALVGGGAIGAETLAAADQGSTASTSAQRHLTLAETYERAAAAQRAEVQALRQRAAADYREAMAGAPNKTGVEYPWVAKVRKASEEAIRAAEAQADVAQRHAEYHRFRAQELQGR
jgi:hypothetical protein